METKYCPKCECDLPIDEFSWKSRSKGTRSSYCKKCNKEYNKQHYFSNKAMYKSKARAYEEANGGRLCLRYNITPEDFERMYSKYDGLCWVCKEEVATVVDHDHSCCSREGSCGKCVRGLLCHRCNTGIGFLRDSIVILKNAIIYLMSNRMSL